MKDREARGRRRKKQGRWRREDRKEGVRKEGKRGERI
jgi:hypothetical protein